MSALLAPFPLAANQLAFVIEGPPRTKKTSNRIIRFGKKKEFVKIMPSEQYIEWHKLSMQQAPVIRTRLRAQSVRAGLVLPITEPVRVKAVFYREKRTGDLVGYMQALGDWLQESKQRNGKTVRTGAGIILDDSQIDSWDGSRREHDKMRPRIEVLIEIIPGGQIEMPLEEEF